MQPQLPPVDLVDPVDPEPEPAPEPAPTNRAARRGKADKQVPADAARYRGSAGGSRSARSRSAQGRRVNPVRRTG